MFESSRFNNGDQFLLTWNVDNLQNIDYMFFSLKINFNIQFTTSMNQSWKLKSMVGTFENASVLNELNFSNWNTSSVTTMQNTFKNCSMQTSLGIRNWNTSNVVNMSGLFYGLEIFTNLDLSWNTMQVTDMSHMFREALIVLQGNILYWDTSRVTDMSYMFYGLKSQLPTSIQYKIDSLLNSSYMFSSITIPINVGIVFTTTNGQPTVWTTMSHMFENTFNFNNPSVSYWDTRNVTDMSYLFHNCESFNQPLYWRVDHLVNASHMFDGVNFYNSGVFFTSTIPWSLRDTSYMFHNCKQFNHSSVVSWDTRQVTNMEGMFSGTIMFNQNIRNWKTNNVLNMSYMFSTTTLFNQNLNLWNVSKVTNMSHMFDQSSFINGGVALRWYIPSTTDLSYMFNEGSKNTHSSLSILFTGTENVVNMSHMFANMMNVDPQKISLDNTSSVQDMSYLFYYSGITPPSNSSSFVFNQASWNTGNVKDMSYMFAGQANMNSLVSGLNTNQVTTMQGMFENCTSFNQSPPSLGTMTTNVSFMFRGATLYSNTGIGNWNLTNLLHMEHFLDYTGFTPYEYSTILKLWVQQTTLPANIILGANTLYYTISAKPAHDVLTNVFNWTLDDELLDNKMVMEFDILQGNTKIELPLQGRLDNIQIDVNWGDGSFYDALSTKHTFQRPGQYRVTVNDCFTEFGYQDVSGDILYQRYRGEPWKGVEFLTTVWSFNPSLYLLNHGFHGATRLTYVPTTTSTKNAFLQMNYAFAQTIAFEDISMNLYAWNVLRTTEMSHLFAESAFNNDLSWNTVNVIDMSFMFYKNTKFNRSFISYWNTSNVINMSGMFYGASAFNQPLFWNTNNVTTIQYLFRDAISFNQLFTNITGGSWNTNKVVDAGGMFYGALSFNQTIQLSLPQATTVQSMFRNSSYNQNVSYVLSSLRNVVDVSYMFAGNTAFNDPSITRLLLGGKIYSYQHMFDGATSFNQALDWTIKPINNLTIDLTAMFKNAKSFNKRIQFTLENIENCTVAMDSMFEGATNFNQILKINILSLPVNCLLSLNSTFKNATSYNKELFTTFVPGIQFTTMESLFEGATAFNQPILGLEQFSQASNVLTSMKSMFENAVSFDQPVQLNVRYANDLSHMLDNTNISRANYNKIIQYWATQSYPLPYGITLGVWGLEYDAAFFNYRSVLTGQYRWNIDGDSRYTEQENKNPPVLYNKINTGGNDPRISRALRYSQIVNGKGRTVFQ